MTRLSKREELIAKFRLVEAAFWAALQDLEMSHSRDLGDILSALEEVSHALATHVAELEILVEEEESSS